jgi:ethanolamine utilization protein EutA
MGVSVGAATVQLLALDLTLEQEPGDSIARVAEERVLTRRGIAQTPYLDNGTLDVGALGFLLLEAGANSPVLGESVGGRVAVLSGYAAEEDNAYWIGRALADIDYTPYVCLRAGPHLGAVLAAFGGGAVTQSHSPDGELRTVLNVDVGASTTNFALCRGDEILETAAIALGTRPLAFDAAGRITETRPAAARAAEELGVPLVSGAPLAPSDRASLADRLAACIFDVVERRTLSPLAQSLMLTPPLGHAGPIDLLGFTGGGAEYVFDKEERDFGDLGSLVGGAVRGHADELGIQLHVPEAPIRATLLGGLQYQLRAGKPVFVAPPAFALAGERDRQFLAASRRVLV